MKKLISGAMLGLMLVAAPVVAYATTSSGSATTAPTKKHKKHAKHTKKKGGTAPAGGTSAEPMK